MLLWECLTHGHSVTKNLTCWTTVHSVPSNWNAAADGHISRELCSCMLPCPGLAWLGPHPPCSQVMGGAGHEVNSEAREGPGHLGLTNWSFPSHGSPGGRLCGGCGLQQRGQWLPADGAVSLTWLTAPSPFRRGCYCWVSDRCSPLLGSVPGVQHDDGFLADRITSTQSLSWGMLSFCHEIYLLLSSPTQSRCKQVAGPAIGPKGQSAGLCSELCRIPF